MLSTSGKIKKPNIKTLGSYIECVLIMHNILIDKEVPILPELDIPYVEDRISELASTTERDEEFSRSRELRANIAKYLAMLPYKEYGEYSTTN